MPGGQLRGRGGEDGLGAAGGQPRQQVPRGEDPEAEAPGAGGARHQGQLRVEGEGEELLRVRLREQGPPAQQLLPPGLLLGLQHHVDIAPEIEKLFLKIQKQATKVRTASLKITL